jgi:predicted transcriptional regulator
MGLEKKMLYDFGLAFSKMDFYGNKSKVKLAKEGNITYQRLIKTFKIIEEKGIIKVETIKCNQRQHKVTLTEKGEELHQRLKRIVYLCGHG